MRNSLAFQSGLEMAIGGQDCESICDLKRQWLQALSLLEIMCAADACRYVLKNLVRDWGSEGAAERAESYSRIVAELRECFRVRPHGITPVHPVQGRPQSAIPGLTTS